MKPVAADKLLVSLLGIEQEDDATALFPSILGNLDGEGRQIDGYERTLTAINICPHWIHDVFTLKQTEAIRTRKLEPVAHSVAQ